MISDGEDEIILPIVKNQSTSVSSTFHPEKTTRDFRQTLKAEIPLIGMRRRGRGPRGCTASRKCVFLRRFGNDFGPALPDGTTKTRAKIDKETGIWSLSMDAMPSRMPEGMSLARCLLDGPRGHPRATPIGPGPPT